MALIIALPHDECPRLVPFHSPSFFTSSVPKRTPTAGSFWFRDCSGVDFLLLPDSGKSKLWGNRSATYTDALLGNFFGDLQEIREGESEWVISDSSVFTPDSKGRVKKCEGTRWTDFVVCTCCKIRCMQMTKKINNIKKFLFILIFSDIIVSV